MPQEDSLKWVRRFMALAEHIAEWSRDPRTRVGAVITGTRASGDDKKVLGMGFNGFPRGVQDLEHRYADPETKYAMIVHSEANAILDARGHTIRGGVITTTKFPCAECAKLIIQSGLIGVITKPIDPNNASDMRWKDKRQIARTMFAEAGVTAAMLCGDGVHAFEEP